MNEISAEQYLDEAVKRTNEFVSKCVNVDLRRTKDACYLRAIFPCWIYAGGTKKRPIYDLPYLEHCRFTYVVVEIYIKVQDIKHYQKIRKGLVSSKGVQAGIGKLIQEKLLDSLCETPNESDWTYDLADVITKCAKLKRKQISIFADYNAHAIEFNFKTGKTTLLTAKDEEYCAPSKSYLKRISKKIQNKYLFYFLDQGSVQEGETQPKGWMKNAVPFCFYCGMTDLGSEKLAARVVWQERNSPLPLDSVKSILELVPYTISIPLFSFTVFSLLKFFYPKYPSRISACDTYESVTRKLKKAMYVSLEGKNRGLTQEAAELYCGSFLRRSLGGTPARQRKSKYVHDGIVIYSENIKKKYRITERNINSYLVMDACALFVDIQLPQAETAVKITWENAVCAISPNTLQGYRDKVDLLICHFIAWIEGYYIEKLRQWENDNWRAVKESSFEDQCSILEDVFTAKMNDIIGQALDSSKKKLSDLPGSPKRKENFAYLLASFEIFIHYLTASYDASESALIEEIKATGEDTLCKLCYGTESAKSIIKIFSQYISYLFEINAVTVIRGEAKGSVEGWYDPKRNHLLLPYASYYEKFLSFCRKKNFDRVPSSKSKFQSEILAASGFIQLKQNGKNSSYFRADCKVQIAPIGAPKEKVIRIILEPFQGLAPLSKKAIQAISQLDDRKKRRTSAKE